MEMDLGNKTISEFRTVLHGPLAMCVPKSSQVLLYMGPLTGRPSVDVGLELGACSIRSVSPVLDPPFLGS